MAQIDLKYAKIFVNDGTARTGAVNNSSGYAAAAVTMLVDTIVGIIETGTQFTVAGETGLPTHTVTSHSQTSGNTTSITFTPGLVTGGVVDNAVITFGPNRLEINIGEGNFTYDEKRSIVYVRNRGRLSHTRLGDEDPVEVSLDFIWEHIISSAGDPVTIEEAIKGNGNASGWLSSATDKCQPYAVDMEIIYTPPCSTEEMETITLVDFRWEDMSHNFKDATVALKGKCNVTAVTAVRATNTYPN